MKALNIIRVCCIVTILTILSGCAGQNKIVTQDIQFEPEAEDCIKVMTFNIRTAHAWWLDGWTFNNWSNRRPVVIDTIAANAADVIGMQEGVSYQLNEIQKALPQYAKYAVGRVDGKRRGETCAIFYRKDRYELADCGSFWFSKKPDKPGSRNWGNMFARVCSWILLVDKTDRTSFYVYNVHLDNWSQYSREKSVRLLADKIARRRTKAPFIIMGDFNMEIDNPAMVYLEQVGRQDSYPLMVNVWQSVHPDGAKAGTYHEFSGRTTCKKIDHISISESVQALDARIDRHKLNGRYPSDHFPVIATLRVAPDRTISMDIFRK
ncbi:MAG: endonuclease/exonuclease/phosphatase family protein [Sedimentisphaerales bacterium]|nr:endonuclease/exonuclease/phosphatase family protein [Sedimentisphaerales bacterium]